jgi:hypothetical protein
MGDVAEDLAKIIERSTSFLMSAEERAELLAEIENAVIDMTLDKVDALNTRHREQIPEPTPKDGLKVTVIWPDDYAKTYICPEVIITEDRVLVTAQDDTVCYIPLRHLARVSITANHGQQTEEHEPIARWSSTGREE